MEQEIYNQVALIQEKNLEPVQPELKPLRTGDVGKFEEALQTPKIASTHTEDLKSALKYAMVKIGLRSQNWPTDEEKQVLIDHIIKQYGGHTIQEIKLAFDMAITGKLDLEEKEISCYENFSCLYFSKIMASYRDWAKQEYAQIEQSKPALQIENKEDMSMEAMQDWFNVTSEKIKAGKLALEFVPPMLYEWMDNNGNISKTASEKMDYLERAVNYRLGKIQEAIDKEDSATNRNILSEFLRMKSAGCFTGSEITYLKILAKQMILMEMIIGN